MASPDLLLVKYDSGRVYQNKLRAAGFESVLCYAIPIMKDDRGRPQRFGCAAVVMSIPEYQARLAEFNAVSREYWQRQNNPALRWGSYQRFGFKPSVILPWHSVMDDPGVSYGLTPLVALRGAVLNMFDDTYLSEATEAKRLEKIAAETAL